MSLCTYNLKTGKLKSLYRDVSKLPLPGGWWTDGKSILIANMDRQTRKCTMMKVSADNGEITSITGHNENFYRHMALSPDGTLMIYGVLEGRFLGLYIMPAAGGSSLPLAIVKEGHTEGASWSPDGKKIAFTRTQGGNFEIWVMDIDTEMVKKELQLIKR